MPVRRPSAADDRLRALRREAALVASDLAQRLQAAPPEIETFGPQVIEAFRARSAEVFMEIDDHQGRYEGGQEGWFRRMRQVRNHAEWGPRLFASLRSDDGASPGQARLGPPHPFPTLKPRRPRWAGSSPIAR